MIAIFILDADNPILSVNPGGGAGKFAPGLGNFTFTNLLVCPTIAREGGNGAYN